MDVSHELGVLEKAFIRIGSADSDQQFEAVIKNLLCPIILKLKGSGRNVQVMKKVAEILTHVSKRLKSRPLIKLPVESLLDIYLNNIDDTVVKNFLIVYVKMAFARVLPDEHLEYGKKLLDCAEAESQNEKYRLVFCVLFVKGTSRFKNDSQLCRQYVAKYELSKRTIAKNILDIMTDVQLYPYAMLSEGNTSSLPSYVDSSRYLQICSENLLGSDLEDIKLGILEFVSHESFTHDQLFPLRIAASCDSVVKVSSEGDLAVEKMLRGDNAEIGEEALLPIYKMVLGSVKKYSADMRLRLKIIPILTKYCFFIWPQSAQLVLPCLDRDTNSRLASMCINFLTVMIPKSPKNVLLPYAQIITNTLIDMVNCEEFGDIKIKSRIFECIGMVICHVPEVIGSETYACSVFGRFLSALKNTTELRVAITDCLLKISHCFEVCQKSYEFMKLLRENAAVSEDPDIKLVVVHFLAKAYKLDELEARWILLFLSCDENERVRLDARDFLYKPFYADDSNNKKEEKPNMKFDEFMSRVSDLCFPDARKCTIENLWLDAPVKIDIPLGAELRNYMRLCLLHELNPDLVNKKYDANVNISHRIRNNLLNYCQEKATDVGLYLRVLFFIFFKSQDVNCLKCICECLCVAPEVLANDFTNQLELLKTCFGATISDEVRTHVGFIYGTIVACAYDANKLTAEMSSLYDEFLANPSQNIEAKHTTLITLKIAIIQGRGENKAACLSLFDASKLRNILSLIHSKNECIAIAACDFIGTYALHSRLPVIRSVNLSVVLPAAQGCENDSLVGLPAAQGCENASLVGLPAAQGYENASLVGLPSAQGCENDSVVGLSSAKERDNHSLDGLTAMQTAQECENDSSVGLPAAQECKNDSLVGLTAMRIAQECKNDSSVGLPSAQESAEVTTSSLSVVEYFFKILESKQFSDKLKMKIVETLGFLCVGHKDFPHRKYIATKLMETYKEEKNYSMSLAVGDALVNCIKGVYSPRVMNTWTTEQKNFCEPAENCDLSDASDMLQFCVGKILELINSREKFKFKRATSVWLMILLSECAGIPISTQQLSSIQITLLDLLSENDDMVSDICVKSVIFISKHCEGDPKRKKLLGQELVDKVVLMVSSGSSSAVLTMKSVREICFLAHNTKNYEIIYKLLEIGQKIDDNKIDNTQILDELGPFLANIVPQVYVTRLHPLPAIRNCMENIWSVLTKGEIKLANKFENEIFQYICQNLTSPFNDKRLCCVSAVDDFLRTGGVELISNREKDLPNLLRQLFKVMDDMKDLIKNIAKKAAEKLFKIFLNACKVDDVKRRKIFDAIWPTILEYGLKSTVRDIREVNAFFLNEFVTDFGVSIREHLHIIILALLETAGGGDVAAVNAFVMRNYNKIGDAKAAVELEGKVTESVVNRHLSNDTFKNCMPYIDKSVLDNLVPKLQDLMKDNVGFSHKIAVCNFINLLITQKDKELMQPYAGKLLASFLVGLSNSQPVVRQNYATTIGYLCSVAKESSFDNLLGKLCELYTKCNTDEETKSAVGYAFKAILLRNHEITVAKADKIAPVIFYATHVKQLPDKSTDKYIKMWTELWEDITGSMDMALAKHKSGILAYLVSQLSSTSWEVKAQAARAFATFTSKIKENVKNDQEYGNMVESLLKALGGRYWDGKEDILEAVSSLCSHRGLSNDDTSVRVIESLIAEFKKDNLTYRVRVSNTLANVLSNYPYEGFDKIWDIAKKYLSNDEKMDLDEMTDIYKLKESAVKLIGEAWPNDAKIQSIFWGEVLELFDNLLANTTRTMQVIVMNAINCVVKKCVFFGNAMEKDLAESLARIEKCFVFALNCGKHTLLKKSALNLLSTLIEQFKNIKKIHLLANIVNVLKTCDEELSKENDASISYLANQIKEQLQNVETKRD